MFKEERTKRKTTDNNITTAKRQPKKQTRANGALSVT